MASTPESPSPTPADDAVKSLMAAIEARKKDEADRTRRQIEQAEDESRQLAKRLPLKVVLGALLFRGWTENRIGRGVLIVGWPFWIGVGSGMSQAMFGGGGENIAIASGCLLAPNLLISLWSCWGDFRDDRKAIAERIVRLKAEAHEVARKPTSWDDVVVPNATLARLLSLVEMFGNRDPAAPRGILLYGPPGTGKTLIARKIAAMTESHLIAASVPDIKADHVGGSAKLVRDLWQKARSHSRTVFFIDECEGVFAKRGSTSADRYTDEIVQAFLAEWDSGASGRGTLVIGATNRRDLLDPAILSRFGTEVEIPLPDKDGRFRILMRELSAVTTSPVHLGTVLDATAGMSGRDLASLVKDARTAAYPGPVTELHLSAAVERIRGRGATKVSATATWETLILPPAIEEELKATCSMLKHAESAKRQGIAVPRAILLYGPPGTGKTQVARTIANAAGLSFIAVTTADLKGAYVGHSGKNVKDLFERARSSSPAIVFIDEIDVIASARGHGSGQDSYTREIVAQLLQELDGVKATTSEVFVLAATNRREDIDSAILSRFATQMEVPLPNEDARKRITKSLLGAQPLAKDFEAVWVFIGPFTEGLSGRDLRDLVATAGQRAFLRAVKEGTPDAVAISERDFDVALEISRGKVTA